MRMRGSAGSTARNAPRGAGEYLEGEGQVRLIAAALRLATAPTSALNADTHRGLEPQHPCRTAASD